MSISMEDRLSELDPPEPDVPDVTIAHSEGNDMPWELHFDGGTEGTRFCKDIPELLEVVEAWAKDRQAFDTAPSDTEVM
jgi:hypothetical protein